MTQTNKNQPTSEELWAGQSGERWLANVDAFEEMIKPVGDALIKHAACRPGEQIIDVGCGGGAVSREFAKRVGATGLVTGLDISPALVAEASRRAKSAGLANARFVTGDAATIALPAPLVDLVVSRFGVMFFSKPNDAFTHIRGFLKPGGRLAMACWASPKENLWMLELRNVIGAHLELPPPEPRAPGPFAFSEQAYVQEILKTSGFKDVSILNWRENLVVGGAGNDAEAAASFLLRGMSIAQFADEVPQAVRDAIRLELVERFKQYETPQGVQMPASVWMVQSRA